MPKAPAPLDPFAYPFGVPSRSFAVDGPRIAYPPFDIWEGSSVTAERVLAAFSNFDPERRLQRFVGLLTCGSNASPSRLPQKLAGAVCPTAYAVRLKLRGWVPVYAATLADYGAIPATFEWQEDAPAEPFLIILDASSVAPILETETRSNNYDLYAVPPSSLALDADFPLFAFVARYGALRLDGDVIPLPEFAPSGMGGTDINQKTLLKRLLPNIDSRLSFSDLQSCFQDRDCLEALRLRIVERYGCAPKVPGWQKIDVGDGQGAAVLAAVGALGRDADQG